MKRCSSLAVLQIKRSTSTLTWARVGSGACSGNGHEYGPPRAGLLLFFVNGTWAAVPVPWERVRFAPSGRSGGRLATQYSIPNATFKQEVLTWGRGGGAAVAGVALVRGELVAPRKCQTMRKSGSGHSDAPFQLK